jgi:hypothetical protein
VRSIREVQALATRDGTWHVNFPHHSPHHPKTSLSPHLHLRHGRRSSTPCSVAEALRCAGSIHAETLGNEPNPNVGDDQRLRFGEGSQSSIVGHGDAIGARCLECGRGKGISVRRTNPCRASGDFFAGVTAPSQARRVSSTTPGPSSQDPRSSLATTAPDLTTVRPRSIRFDVRLGFGRDERRLSFA